jgi:hypothetical protein
MDGANPYAPPAAALADGGEEAEEEQLPPWILEGQTLLARHGTTLPDICLFTGEPTTRAQRLRYPLSWTSLWFRPFWLIGMRFAMAAYPNVRRPSNVEMGLGPAGRRRHRLVLALIIASVLDLIVADMMFESHTPDGFMLAGLLALCFLGLVLAAWVMRVFRVVKIDRQYAHIALRPQVAAVFARLPVPPPAPRVWWRP